MISVLVCSVNDAVYAAFEENVAATIGTSYELICYKNIQNESIYKVYDDLKRQAKGVYVCFVHEDVLFRTHNWGGKLAEVFAHTANLGLIGVAGCTYKSSIPSGWYIKDELSVTHLIENNKEGSDARLNHLNLADDEYCKVVASIDGVFMALPRHIADQVSFNTLLPGFHAYDTDLSMAVIDIGYKVAVCKDILLEHFSGGRPNKQWLSNHIACNKRWKHLLPLQVVDQVYVHKAMFEIDNHVHWYFVDCMRRFGFSRFEQLKHVINFDTVQTRTRTFNFIRTFILIFFKWFQ